MRWSATCVSGRAHRAEDGLRRHIVAFFQMIRVGIEMRVVVNATASANYRNRLTTKPVLTNVVNITLVSD